MDKLPMPENEMKRLKALKEYNILDTLSEEEFDRLTELASAICGVPIALVSLIDENRQWFKSRVGLDDSETARDISFCQYTIMGDSLFEVEDATNDERFKDNPLVTQDPHIRFYAGYPLIDPEGYALGSLCVIDHQPGKLSKEQQRALKILAKEVVAQIVAMRDKADLENFKKLFNVSIDMICIAGLDAFLRKVNPAFVRGLGWTEEEILKGSLLSFIHPDDVEKTKTYLRAIIREEKTFNFSNRVKTKSGAYKELQWIGTSDMENQSIYAIARDVTAQIQLEKELKEAKIIAEQHAYAKDLFLANMSHEIRTPMNAITGFANLLADTKLDGEQRDFVSNINIASENLLGIINDILDISKIESGHIMLEEIPFNVRELVKNVHSVLNQKALEAGLDMSYKLDETLPDFLIGDPTRLNQILLNLTNNAIKFTPKGHVHIQVSAKEIQSETCTVVFSVSDTGIGISEDKQKAVFERFTQADTDTTRRFGGTGLGLSISKSLIELLDGEIALESRLGEGTTFYVTLAFKKMNLEVSGKIPTHMLKMENEQKIRVLLVEDNILNQKLALKVLENFGFSPELAENGRIGVEKVQQNQYDVVLMDLQMPEMDGYQATDFIRNTLKLKIPIIAMTAHSLVGEKDKCIAIGMDDYIPKPFSPNELFNKIVSFVNAQKSSDSALGTDENLVDLSYISELSGGNKEFENEMIELFLSQSPTDMDILEKAVGDQNYTLIKALSHKLKSSYALLGINENGILEEMEQKAADKTDSQWFESNYSKLKNIFVKACRVLEQKL